MCVCNIYYTILYLYNTCDLIPSISLHISAWRKSFALHPLSKLYRSRLHRRFPPDRRLSWQPIRNHNRANQGHLMDTKFLSKLKLLNEFPYNHSLGWAGWIHSLYDMTKHDKTCGPSFRGFRMKSTPGPVPRRHQRLAAIRPWPCRDGGGEHRVLG